MPIVLPFTESGQGPVVVLLHGLGGDRNQWLDVWPETLPFRTLRPDLPGHGQADWLPASGCSFDSFADVTYQWLTGLVATDPIVLAGISMGAGVALRLALLAPERVQKLVLVRPAWLDQSLPDNLLILHRLGQEWLRQGSSQTAHWLQQDEQYQALAIESPACAQSVLGQLSRPHPALAARTLIDLPADCPIADLSNPSSLTMPTLMIGSDRDPLHPLDMAHTLTNWLPNARFGQVVSRYDQPETYREQIQAQLVSFLGR